MMLKSKEGEEGAGGGRRRVRVEVAPEREGEDVPANEWQKAQDALVFREVRCPPKPCHISTGEGISWRDTHAGRTIQCTPWTVAQTCPRMRGSPSRASGVRSAHGEQLRDDKEEADERRDL